LFADCVVAVFDGGVTCLPVVIVLHPFLVTLFPLLPLGWRDWIVVHVLKQNKGS
jgi:hypothetical protein